MDKEDFFQSHIYGRWWWFPPLASAVLYVLSAWYIWCHPQVMDDNRKAVHDNGSILLLIIWSLGPPSIFFLEYCLQARRPSENLPSIEAFKYSQDLASKFWVAALGLLIFLYAKKIPGT